ncbi:hypothetical protein [Acinetobacter sp. MD2]|uniref:hypothetical protein n=1 Tax=Acinetobacter sp. MD2 TaxID=2600066 RepID=UPI002D1EEAE1|nr:hypothetical protein [Acinetobacter sp. MD2]MEB3768169.1 hypothetical protein [Acinetobacter sp. MD2]
MKLRYLVSCLFALSMSGCSQHYLKPNENVSLEQRSVEAVQSLYTTSGFDYSGQVKFIAPVTAHQKASPVVNDAVLMQKLKDYIVLQGMTLQSEEIKAFELALQQISQSGTEKGEQASMIASHFLQDLTISYDGGIDYRKKLLALNLTARYDTQGLLVQARYPMILDVQNAKFYSDFFALMPYFVSAENRNQFSYVDFSQYKDKIDQVNLAELVGYIKEVNALPYVLAKPNQLQRLNLSDADKKLGGVEKIRLTSTFEEIAAQLLAYSRVNQDYLTQTVFQVESDAAANKTEAASETASTLKTEHAADAATQTVPIVDAKKVIQPNATLAASEPKVQVEQHKPNFAKMSAEEQADWATAQLDELSTAALAISDQSDAQESSAEAVEDQDRETIINQDAHEAENQSSLASDELSRSKCKAGIGKANLGLDTYLYCAVNYDIDLFQSKSRKDDLGIEEKVEQFSRLTQTFSPQVKNQRMSAAQFKTVWQEKQPEVDKILVPAAKRHTLLVDLVLDGKGRLLKTAYDATLLDSSASNDAIHLMINTEFKNFGSPKAINQEVMQTAKPLKDLAKNSILRDYLPHLDGSKDEQDDKFDRQLQKLADESYARHHSYLKTYQTIYGVLFARDYPQAVKHYSAQDIQDVATLMFYRHFERVDTTRKLTRQEQTRLKQLEKQYPHLDEIEPLYEAAMEYAQKAKVNVEQNGMWQKIQQQYRTPEQRFEHAYEAYYLLENPNERSNPVLKHMAGRLAKFYIASRQNIQSEEIFKGLSQEEYDYLETSSFKMVYVKMLQGNSN